MYTFIELSPDLPPTVRDRLLYSAYRSSHDCLVKLWLHGLTVDEAQQSLDRAVRDLGTRVAGIEYGVDLAPEEAATAARMADVRVLTTDECLPYLGPDARTLGVDEVLEAVEAGRCFCPACTGAGTVRHGAS